MKGTILEILTRNLFRPLLPADVGVGTGQIIDHRGNSISSQTDIILYDKSILPPILYDSSTGLFPVESVLYAIEVKTTLNAQELAHTHESAKLLRNFAYIPGLQNEDGTPKHHRIEHARSVVFALQSDLSGAKINEAERYEKIYKDKNDKPYIRAICIAGKEYWYDSGEHWTSFANEEPYDDILGFISGVMNTYRHVSQSRHNPLLGNYTMPESEPLLGPATEPIKRIPLKCNKCGHAVKFKPDFGDQNITINGKISCTSPCSQCGGKLESIEGIHQFIKGNFIDSKPLESIEQNDIIESAPPPNRRDKILNSKD